MRPLVARVVQDEVGFGPGIGCGVDVRDGALVAPIAEKHLAETFFVGDFEKACRDDLVGVDVIDQHGHDFGC